MDPIEREQDHTTELALEIRGFGKPGKLTRDHILRAHRALHHAFGSANFTITHNGFPVNYDHLADDGHHEGHTRILTTEEPIEDAFAQAGSNGSAP